MRLDCKTCSSNWNLFECPSPSVEGILEPRGKPSWRNDIFLVRCDDKIHWSVPCGVSLGARLARHIPMYAGLMLKLSAHGHGGRVGFHPFMYVLVLVSNLHT